MNVKRILSALATIIIIITLSACDGMIAAPETLMRMPRPMGELEEISAAFEASVGSDYLLRFPASGYYRSAFVKHDLDGNGTDGVLVFYSLIGEADIVRINVLRDAGSGWESIYDMETSGIGVERLAFASMCAGRPPKIIVGLTTHSDKLLNVYFFEDDILHQVELEQSSYMEFAVVDMTLDGQDDLLLIHYDPDLSIISANLCVINEYGIIEIAYSTLVDSEVASYIAVNAGIIKETTVDGQTRKITGVFLDAVKADGRIITELIYLDIGQDEYGWPIEPELKAPFTDASSPIPVNNTTQRVATRYSMIIDERIAIPIDTLLPGSNYTYLTRWYVYDGANLNYVLVAYMNIDEGYYINLEGWWQRDGGSNIAYDDVYVDAYIESLNLWRDDSRRDIIITVYVDEDSGEHVFSLWDSYSEMMTWELFRILAAPEEWWRENESAFELYFELDRHNNIIYLCRVNAEVYDEHLTREYIVDEVVRRFNLYPR